MGPWAQQDPGDLCGKEEDGDQGQVDFFVDASFSRDTYDEIQDGTGQVSQRPLGPPSPDFTPEVSWSPAQTGPLTQASPSSPSPSSSFGGKVHLCHCGKAYTLKSMRDRHVKMQHLNLRPFGCPVCSKTFKMKHHLTKHLKTHGGLRPFQCSLCGKKVVWRDSFLRHQARCQRLAGSAGPEHLGQVKVEDVDFQGDLEDGMGLLGAVSGMVDQLRAGPEGGPVFKEEAADGFGGTDSGGVG